jgi:hypothetical protein
MHIFGTMSPKVIAMAIKPATAPSATAIIGFAAKVNSCLSTE